jgi:hypothetical protein
VLQIVYVEPATKASDTKKSTDGRDSEDALLENSDLEIYDFTQAINRGILSPLAPENVSFTSPRIGVAN